MSNRSACWRPWRPWLRNRWIQVYGCTHCLTVMGGVYVLPWPWFLMGPFVFLPMLDKIYSADQIRLRSHTCPDFGKQMELGQPPLFFTARYRKGRWELSQHSLQQIQPSMAQVLQLEDRRKQP